LSAATKSRKKFSIAPNPADCKKGERLLLVGRKHGHLDRREKWARENCSSHGRLWLLRY
jgi:hypothetical protein